MVRISLDACLPDIDSPANIYQDEERKRLLVRKGLPLTEKIKQLLLSNNVRFIDFPLPFEVESPPPYTFSEEIESALFRLAQNTFTAFKENSVKDPFEIRKTAYDILSEAAKEFQPHLAHENPVGSIQPKRHPAFDHSFTGPLVPLMSTFMNMRKMFPYYVWFSALITLKTQNHFCRNYIKYP